MDINFREELRLLLKAKAPCIWIKTYEEEKVIDEIKNIIAREMPGMKVKAWDLATGVAELDLASKKVGEAQFAPIDAVISRQIIGAAHKKDSSNAWILKDLQLVTNLPPVIRAIRNLAEETSQASYNPLIAVSPIVDIPLNQDKLWRILDFSTPSKEDLSILFNTTKRQLEVKKQRAVKPADADIVIPSDDLIKRCVDLAFGLTLNEVNLYIKKSLFKYRTLNEDIFYDARQDLINKTGILQLQECHTNMDNMGGNTNFKNWIEDIEVTFSPEAQEFGVEKSKGFLALGVPGTAKTMSAEMIASTLGLPLLKFNMAKVMHSHVGQSEKNMELALNVIKACAPCVLLIDEAEKTLSGTGSSNKTDGGTLMRVVGQLLQFLSSEDSSEIFTIMTSNDVSQLPPELTRSGRLDTIWYFGLPTKEERKEIFKIHFGLKNIELSDETLEFAGINTAEFTGAEIKEAVKIAIRKAFIRFKQDGNRNITNEDIESAIGEIIPVSKSSKEKINVLKNYATNRARFASVEEEESDYDDYASTSDIDF